MDRLRRFRAFPGRGFQPWPHVAIALKRWRSTPHRQTNKAGHFWPGPWPLELAADHRPAAEPFAAPQMPTAAGYGLGAPLAPSDGNVF
jgi:hypothetical protein